MLPFSISRSASPWARETLASYSRLADVAIRIDSSRASPTIRSLCWRASFTIRSACDFASDSSRSASARAWLSIESDSVVADDTMDSAWVLASCSIESRASSTSWASSSSPGMASLMSSISSSTSPRGTTQPAVIGTPRASSTIAPNSSSASKTRYTATPSRIVVVTSVPGVASVTALPGSVCRLLGRRTDPFTCTLDVIMSARALSRQRRTGAETQWDPTMSDAEYPQGVFRWRSHGTRSGTCGGARVSAGRVNDLGDPVGPDPRFHPVCGCASRGAPVDDCGAARRRPAPHAGGRGRAGRRGLVMLLRRRGPGPVVVSQGRQLHRRHGLRNRLDEPGGGVGHHPGPADGLAVHRGGIRRRPADDRGTCGVVPPVRAYSARRCRTPTGRSRAGRLDGRSCRNGHVGPTRGLVLAATAVTGGLYLLLACFRHGVGGDSARPGGGVVDRGRHRGLGARIILATLLFR